MSGRLSGKVCIITGTGGSMGRDAALVFAREGASVVGCDLNVDAAEATVEMVQREGGTMASLQPCRLSRPADCQALVDFAVRRLGRVDVLFNNAAMASFNWIEDISDEEWDRNRRDEVDLVFYLTRAAWPYLKKSRGVIVNTASLNALISFKNLGSLAHTTAKAGVIAMTRQLEPDPGAAQGPGVGTRHARQDVAGPSRPAGGGCERRPVPGFRGELVRDGRRHCGRRRDEGLVKWCIH